MHFTYNNQIPEKDAYFRLLLTTGWNEHYLFTADEAHLALNGSWYCVSAYSDNELVGFGRVISDGIHHALIADLIVFPDFQDKGIGSTILKMLIDRCEQNRIRDVQLFSAKGKAGFYERFGFISRQPDAPGMERKKQ